MRVEVRDKGNRERLLGYLPSSTVPINRPFYRVAIYPRLSVMDWQAPIDVEATISFQSIDLEIGWRDTTHEEGYFRTSRAEYLTNTPLETLLMHPDFRLPGESEIAAEARRHYS